MPLTSERKIKNGAMFWGRGDPLCNCGGKAQGALAERIGGRGWPGRRACSGRRAGRRGGHNGAGVPLLSCPPAVAGIAGHFQTYCAGSKKNSFKIEARPYSCAPIISSLQMPCYACNGPPPPCWGSWGIGHCANPNHRRRTPSPCSVNPLGGERSLMPTYTCTCSFPTLGR